MNPAQAYTIMFFTGGFLLRIRNINAGLFSYINAASWWNLFCVSRCCAKSTGWTGITGGADAFVQSYDHGGGICCRHDRESLSASGGMGLFRTAVQLSGADLSFIL